MSLNDVYKELGIPEHLADEWQFDPLIISYDNELWMNPDIYEICEDEIEDDELIIDTFRITIENMETGKKFWMRVKSHLLDFMTYDEECTEEMIEPIMDCVFDTFMVCLLDDVWIPGGERFNQTELGIELAKLMEDGEKLKWWIDIDNDVHVPLLDDVDSITYH